MNTVEFNEQVNLIAMTYGYGSQEYKEFMNSQTVPKDSIQDKAKKIKIDAMEIVERILANKEAVPAFMVTASEILKNNFKVSIEEYNGKFDQCFTHKKSCYGLYVRMNGDSKGMYEVMYTKGKYGWKPLAFNPIDGDIKKNLEKFLKDIIEVQRRADYHNKK